VWSIDSDCSDVGIGDFILGLFVGSMEGGEPVDYTSDQVDSEDIWVSSGGCEMELFLELPSMRNTSLPPVSFGSDQLETFSPSDLLSFSPNDISAEVPQATLAEPNDNPSAVPLDCRGGVASVCKDGPKVSGEGEGFEVVEGFDKVADAGVARFVKERCGTRGGVEEEARAPADVNVERDCDKPPHVEERGKGKVREAGHSKEGFEKHSGPKKKRKTSWIKSRQVGVYAVGEDVEWHNILEMSKLTIVGKVIGRFFARRTMVSWVDRFWKEVVGYSPVVDLLTRGWFAVTFAKEEDLPKILNRSWSLDHSPVLLKKWHPLFDASIERVDIIPIWVRMPALPLQYWSEFHLRGIGNMLGTCLEVDLSFLKTHIKQVARVLVSINIREGLAETITLKRGPEVIVQILDYENVPFRCRRCHAYGHPISECKIPARKNAEGRQKQATTEPTHKSGDGSGPSFPSVSAESPPRDEEGSGEKPTVPAAPDGLLPLAIVPVSTEPATDPSNLGIPTFSLSAAFNLFVNQFSVMNLDWVAGFRALNFEDPSGLFKNFPLNTPSDGLDSNVDVEAPVLALVEGPTREESLIKEVVTPPLSQDESSDSGYFLRSCKKSSNGGLGKDILPARSKRGRKSNLHKAQSRARRDVVDGKQLSIEKALRAGKGRTRGRR